jgi:hypothetical protein
MTTKEPTFKPSKNTIFYMKRELVKKGFKQGQLSEKKRDIEIIDEDYPSIPEEKSRLNFIEWKEKVKQQIQGEHK